MGLEGFVNWTDPMVSESATEREAKMSNLTIGFVVLLRKRAANVQGEATPGSEGPNDKHFK